MTKIRQKHKKETQSGKNEKQNTTKMTKYYKNEMQNDKNQTQNDKKHETNDTKKIDKKFNIKL